MSEAIFINVTPRGEAEYSLMYVTRIDAAERPHTDVQAGVWYQRNATPRMA